jgi:putative lipoprotein (rSAM/lipoprotein system)
MKNLRNTFLRGSNKLLGYLLLLLGFSSACSQMADEYGAPYAEYGVPMATFIVKGNVVSDASDQVIPAVRVVMPFDTVYTDQNGNYQIENQNYPTDQSFLLEFSDVDGPQNGSFETLDTTVTFSDPQFTGGDGDWNAGETEKEVNIRMKPQD